MQAVRCEIPKLVRHHHSPAAHPTENSEEHLRVNKRSIVNPTLFRKYCELITTQTNGSAVLGDKWRICPEFPDGSDEQVPHPRMETSMPLHRHRY